jgi:trimeric autotransporter adhesin
MIKKIFSALFLLCYCSVNTNVLAQSTLIHYWHFNNFSTAMYTPSIIGVAADYSLIDTSKAKILYAPMPGTSLSYSTYEDAYATAATDTDIYNLRLSQPAGNALRPRNPCDSMYLLFYIPTTHYRNIKLRYASQTSSTAHGPSRQVFDYSVDSGATWRTSGLSEPMDSAGTAFKLITVSFTSDSAVNNNPKLVFRITYNGNTTGTSGNNRFDNVTVDGDSIYIVNTITTTPAAYGPYCNTSTATLSVPFTSVGTYTGGYSVQLSNPDGTWPSGLTNIIGSGVSSPIFAAISSGTAPGTHYRIRVINTSPVTYGSDNGTDITIGAPPTAYTVTGGGTYCAGGTGVSVGLINSQAGVSYQLYLGGVPTGTAILGTGSSISFGPQTSAGSYTAKGSYPSTVGCSTNMTGSVTISINPSPAAITGTTNVCVSSSVSLFDATTGGTWSKSNSNINITSSGSVSGVAGGTSIVTYTGTDGCFATTTVNVNTVATITGTTSFCNGSSVTLSDATGVGYWTSSTTNATVGSSSGIVTGVNTGSSVISYTSSAGCSTATTITVNAQPTAISGPTALCATATITLGNGIPGGTWISTSPSNATIGSSSGMVTGVATGTTNITYTMPGGCYAATTVTVSLSPGPITGHSSVCSSATDTLGNTVPGGLWSSGSPSYASVGSLSGIVTGATSGTATITYSLGGSSCTVTRIITVNASPFGITGTTSICSGTSSTLFDASSGGVWSSAATSVATISSGGTVTSSSPGTTTISYTLAGCSATTVFTVNITPSAIGGVASVCVGSSTSLSDSPTGGSWTTTSSYATIGSASGSVSGVSAGIAAVTYTFGSCAATRNVSINPVPALTGPSGVCVGDNITLSPSISGGSWTSSATTFATVSAGSVHGVAHGVADISYTLPTGCIAVVPVTVNTIPTAIIGPSSVCVNGTSSLSDGAAGGSWSISPVTNATVDVFSGQVAGITAGPATVTYSLGTGCTVTTAITVNPLPDSITGPLQVCQGLITTASDASPAGSWSSSFISLAAITSTGSITASSVSYGIDTIYYTIPTGCRSYRLLTVNPLPPAITVSGYVCIGLTTHFSDAVSGGTWSSGDLALATADPTTGIITGIASGSPVITYTLPTGCINTVTVTVNAVAPTISGIPAVCQGLTTTLADSLTGGAWSSSDNTIASVSASSGVVTGVAAGYAVISYTHGGICPAAAYVTVNPLPSTISGPAIICPAANGSFTDVGIGVWHSSNTLVATIDTSSGIARGVGGGNAIITYTLPTGCIATTSVSVYPVPAPISGPLEICNGTSVTLHDTARGSWSSSDATIAAIGSTGIVTGLSGGSVTISYTVATGCAATVPFNVVYIPTPAGLSHLCAWGDTLTLTEPDTTGVFSSTSAIVTNLGHGVGRITTYAPGPATITYTVLLGCSASAPFTVNPIPSAIAGNNHICIGFSSPLTDSITGGTWSSSSSSVVIGSVSGIASGSTLGSSTITYTLPTGCSVTEPATVVALPSSIVGPSSLCSGASGILSDSVSGGSWSSSNTAIAAISAGGTLYGIASGNATITYSPGAGCYATLPVTVNPLPTIYITSGGGSYCAGGIGEHITLSGSQHSVSYQLFDGSSPVDTAVSGFGGYIDFGAETTSGTYYVIATNSATGCIGRMSGSPAIYINPLPATFSVIGGGSYCPGTSGATIGLAGSATGVNYQLYSGTSRIGSALTGTGTAITFGTHTAGSYTVVADNSTTLCTATMADTVIVALSASVSPSVSIRSSVGDTVCLGSNVAYDATSINGGVSPLYIWKVNGAYMSSSASYSYTPSNHDLVSVTLVSDAPCASPDSVTNTISMTVDSIVIPVVSITATPGLTISSGDFDTLYASVSNGGANPAYQWTKNGVPIPGATSATYVTDNIDNGDSLSCIVTGQCNGIGKNTVQITVHGQTGVAQISSSDNVHIFPNPSSGEITIKGTIASHISDHADMRITDMLGQTVFKSTVPLINGSVSSKIHINDVANGMYLLSIGDDEHTLIYHIVIAR